MYPIKIFSLLAGPEQTKEMSVKVRRFDEEEEQIFDILY
jgi:hypothetical protein